MSEELVDASYSLPRTMMYSTLANGALGLIMIISYCYCITDILEGEELSTSTRKRVDDANLHPSDGHGNKVRLHPSLLQCNWILCGSECYVICCHHCHHFLLHDDACHYLTPTLRLVRLINIFFTSL